MKNVALILLNPMKRERMGYIIGMSSCNTVFKITTSRISLAIDKKLKEVEKVLYFESFIVVEPGLTTLKVNY